MKIESPIGNVARFAIIDFDRYLKRDDKEQEYFKKLVLYCNNEQKKGNPTFLIVSNPDFDIYILKHDLRYKHQKKEEFLLKNYNYKSLADFKCDTKVFEIFSPQDEYIKTPKKFIESEFVVKNHYNFNFENYTFTNMSIIFTESHSNYKTSNMIDLIKLLNF